MCDSTSTVKINALPPNGTHYFSGRVGFKYHLLTYVQLLSRTSELLNYCQAECSRNIQAQLNYYVQSNMRRGVGFPTGLPRFAFLQENWRKGFALLWWMP